MGRQDIASFVRKTLAYPKNTALLGESVTEFWLHYFSKRRFPQDQEFYVVYTDVDHGIPFQAGSALDYLLVNFRFIPTSMRLGIATPGNLFDDIRHAYVDIAVEGAEAFREVPTIMPRPTQHDGCPLDLAQAFLKPISCAPSLHTAAPFFAYNIGARYFPEKELELRQHVGNVISSIIKTKHHAMIDVAFGIFLAKRAITDKLGLDFFDLKSFLTQEQKNWDKVPYEHVYRICREINELERGIKGKQLRFAEIMGRYFQEIGLPRVKQEQSNCFYDLAQKALVYCPELKVGKGLL